MTEKAKRSDEAAVLVAETLRHNQEALDTQVNTAVANATIYRAQADGKRCFYTPINLYVDSTTGRIIRITSTEAERRAAAMKSGSFIQNGNGFIEPTILSEQTAAEDSSSIVKLPALHMGAFPDFAPADSEGMIRIDRPDSWVRNDQVVLSNDFEPGNIDELIPDPIERGIVRQSLDSYNATPEPSEANVASFS